MFASDFTAFIHAHGKRGSSLYSQAHEEYTGSTHIHYGLRVPDLRAFVKSWSASKGAAVTRDAWLSTLDALYMSESVEEKYFAGMLLAQYPKFRATLPLDRLNGWLNHLIGWAEVDSTCQSTFTAREILARWDEWETFLRALALDPNINKRRASLVLLIRALRESDDPRLIALALEQIDKLRGEQDILISKAVSWVLRESIKRHRAAVESYVQAHADHLQKSVVREFRMKLFTGKKNSHRRSFDE